MRERIEKFYLSIVTGRRKGFLISLLLAFLWLLAQLYLVVIHVRYLLYRLKLLPARSVTAWVISVGNITLGGTGKTPVVERLAGLLHSRGRKVAVISRGYRRKTGPLFKRLKEKISGAPTTRVVSDGQKVLLNSRVAGDEPYMLAVHLEGVPVLINRNRVKGALYAVRRFKADTLIIDDGYQHLSLNRDLDIVLVDADCPFGNGYLLPRGVLRELPRSLARADLLIITKAMMENRGTLKKELAGLNQRAEILVCRHKPMYLYDVRTSIKTSLDFLKGAKVASLAGIARPEGFERSLSDLGAVVISSRRFADHHFYQQQELIDSLNEASRLGAEILVTTEKDAVRFARLPPGGLPVYALRVKIENVDEREDFDKVVLRFLRQREKRSKA